MPALREITPKKTPTGVSGVQFDEFVGPEIKFRGWWLNPTKMVRVPVPVFQHAFYPKLEHTPLDIKQHVQKRIVTIPSLQQIHEHGIEVSRAFFVAEVLVHNRHIKNWNFLRVQFPAFAKATANRDGVAFIFPANDNPSFRAKRKEVLSILRGNLTPLFIKGQHYTSGRMSFFFTAPKGAANRFKRSFNFDEALKEEKQSLVEFWSFNKAKKPRRVYNRKPKAITSRESAMAAQIVAQTANKMEHQLLPLAVSKLDIDPNSDAGHAMQEFLADTATSRELLRRTRGKVGPSKLQAVKRWVKEVFVPATTEFLKYETKEAVKSLSSFAFRTTVAIAANEVVGQVKISEWGKDKKFVQAWDYEPYMKPGVGIGSGTLSVRMKRNTLQEVNFQKQVKELVLHGYKTMAGDEIHDSFIDLFEFRYTPSRASKPITLTLNKQKVQAAVKVSPKIMGRFANQQEKFDETWFRQVNTQVIPALSKLANEFYKKGEPTPAWSTY